jgi:Effector protein
VQQRPSGARRAEAWQEASHAIFAHELIHGADAAYGRMEPEIVSSIHNYERQAVGLPLIQYTAKAIAS